MNREKFQDLMYEALETELGGVKVYETALKCAQNDELKEEWERYLEETKGHVEKLIKAFGGFGLDPQQETPGRQVCRHIAASLVQAMQMALKAGDPAAAQVVACECVVHAETKDHLNWELLGECAEELDADAKSFLCEIIEEVEEQEDEHYYHTKGWTRELWIEGLGMPAVVPPPEEEKDVHTAIGAEKAKNARTKMLRGKKKSKKETETK
jgi:hypothetical protein